MTEAPPRLSLHAINKAFGSTQALSDVGLTAGAGEIHALIGENGAGKSTLMKILAGAVAADSGQIALDGKPYAPRGPLDARDQGVAIVYQEPLLCPELSIEENVVLGLEPSRYGFVDRRAMRERVQRSLSQVSAEKERALHPERLVGRLAPSERQLVAIARALALADCRVLILDEPTSSLTADDVERLFSVVRRLSASGITIVYISHFLEEVQRIATRYTVLRDGKHVVSGTIAETQREALVSSMAGREVKELFPRSDRRPGETVLDLSELAGNNLPKRASLTLHAGEVLGIAGLVGSGRTELLRAIFGLDAVKSGEIRLKASIGAASPAARLAQGMGMLSEDRKGEGLAEQLTLAENLTLSRLSDLGPAGFVLPRRAAAVTRSFIERLGIRCRDPEQRVSDLSGGNQQKIALARLLYHDCDVLLLDEPTRGIDVGSRADVYRIIDELAGRGRAVLMVSSYLPELLGVCDRIAVMSRGELKPARPARELTEHALLLEATAP